MGIGRLGPVAARTAAQGPDSICWRNGWFSFGFSGLDLEVMLFQHLQTARATGYLNYCPGILLGCL